MSATFDVSVLCLFCLAATVQALIGSRSHFYPSLPVSVKASKRRTSIAVYLRMRPSLLAACAFRALARVLRQAANNAGKVALALEQESYRQSQASIALPYRRQYQRAEPIVPNFWNAGAYSPLVRLDNP
jgi:hypothetical protein